MSRSEPTSAFPVARIRFSPFTVRGMSLVPVCFPFSDHSVSPWRMMKTRGVVIFAGIESATRRALLSTVISLLRPETATTSSEAYREDRRMTN